MPECNNPLWPCAMTGAVACLAGFEGITVIIHGSSGCYYYPATLLRAPLRGTFIVEEDVIFGSEQRLLDVVGEVSSPSSRIAVVTTCVPAILGEDIRAMLAAHDIILVDSPGFSGDFEQGYRNALLALKPLSDPATKGINIDGASLFDPFSRGNIQELSRLFANAGVPVATIFSMDTLTRVWQASRFTVTTNEDIASGVGTRIGSSLGLDALKTTFEKIGTVIKESDIEPVIREIEREEERINHACDKYLRRFDPPRAAIFGWPSYAVFAANSLATYLDAEIACIGSRTPVMPGLPYPVQQADGLSQVQAMIETHEPDLVIGSSFERPVSPAAAFVGLTPPLRGQVRLTSRPVAGIAGTLIFMEDVLNACMDRRR
jgi:nitrogenase molybdenum-iron protein alpha/beta subunit